MRRVFAGIAVVLAGMSLVAWYRAPKDAASDKIVLTWVSDDNPARRNQVALFNKLYPQYEVRLDASNMGIEKILVQSSSGVGPDLFDSMGGAQPATYARSGVAWDVTDELRKRGIGPELTWPFTTASFMVDGRVYGFPCNAVACGVWYHKDVFDKLGVPHPPQTWTWPEFLEIAKKLVVRENGRIVQYAMVGMGNQIPEELMRTFGGRRFNDSGTRSALDSFENAAGLQYWLDLMYVHEVMPTPMAESAMATQGGWGSGAITLFGAKRAAMALGGRWWLCILRAYDGLSLGVVEFPFERVANIAGGSRATFINAHSPRREHALVFLEYLAGEPYSQLINEQADAFGPLRRLSNTPEFLHNPAYPAEDYNHIWATIAEKAVPEETSPFINRDVETLIFTRQLDLIRNRQKTPREGLAQAARDVDAEIQRNIRKDPALKQRYEEAVSKERQYVN